MSKESSVWLNHNTLIGFTDQRGHAWHYRASDQGLEPNHYPGPVPVADIERRLFGWEPIETVKITFTWPDGTTTDTTHRKAVGRSDTYDDFGIFAPGYRPHAFREWLIGNVQTVLDDDLAVGSAGLLKGGAVGWVSVEMPETVKTPEGVDFRPHLLATTSLDGSLATTYKRAAQLVVCDNTLALALREHGQQYKLRHRKGSTGQLKVAEAREALQIIYEASDEFASEITRLCQTTVTDKEWSEFLDAHVPVPEKPGNSQTMAERKRGELAKLWNYDARVSPWRNTAFGVLQATNTYDHHIGTMRNINARAERNMINAVDGTTDKNDAEVLRLLGTILDRPLVSAA